MGDFNCYMEGLGQALCKTWTYWGVSRINSFSWNQLDPYSNTEVIPFRDHNP